MTAAELVNGGAIALVILLLGWFWRALNKGDIVLGREYTRVLDQVKAITERADTAASEAKQAAELERQRTTLLIENQAAQIAERRKGAAP